MVPSTPEMHALPSVQNWLRFRAERRHVSTALTMLEQREARALRRLADGEHRAAARQGRLSRWSLVEKPHSTARLTAISARQPGLNRSVAVAAERLRMQAATKRLLQLPGNGGGMGSLDEQKARIDETAAYEELKSLSERWADAVRLAAAAAKEEDDERAADEDVGVVWDWEGIDWLMRHASWRIEVQMPDGAPPATTELLEQRTRLAAVRARLEPLLAADLRAREVEMAAAPAQNDVLDAVGARLQAEQREREAEAQRILTACRMDEQESKLRKEKEEEVEGQLAAVEASAVERRHRADQRAREGEARNMRRRIRQQHADERSAALDTQRKALEKAEAAQALRLRVEARRAERQQPAQSMVRLRLSALVGVRPLQIETPSPRSKSRGERGGPPPPTIAVSLHTTRVPAQRLYSFDRTREDMGRAELLRICDEAEAIIAAAGEEVASVEADSSSKRRRYARRLPLGRRRRSSA